MASKPENVFIRSVNRHLTAHFEKMNNPYRSGTADSWYSGVKGDAWIEYKFIPTIPKNATIVPDLSARQLDWLQSRLAEGRNVHVVVGCPDGGVVIPPERWVTGVTPAEFRSSIQTRQELAAWIQQQTGARACRSHATSTLQQMLSLPSIESPRRQS